MDEDDDDAPPLPPPPPPPSPLVDQITTMCFDAGLNLKSKPNFIFKLTEAIENDDTEALATLFAEDGAHANSTLSFGVPILLKAVRSVSLNAVDFLLTRGADPLPSVRFLMCPQAFSSIPESVEMLQKLLPYLDKSILRHTEGKNLLYRSTSCPDLSIFEYILRHGVGFSHHDLEILHRLIKHPDGPGSLRMIEMVLERSDNLVNFQGNVGFDLLKQCLGMKKLDIFHYLVTLGADPFHKTHTGNSLLHYAGCDIDNVCFLCDAGLDINLPNTWGLRAFDDMHDLPKHLLVLLVLLGKTLNESQEAQLEGYAESFGVASLYQRLKDGDFDSIRLKMLSRKCIRNIFWKRNCQTIEAMICDLPIPDSIKLYIDVKAYSQYLLNLGT